MKIYVRQLDDREAIHSIDMTGKSEKHCDRTVQGLMRNMDLDNFFVDDTECTEHFYPSDAEELIDG